MRPSSTSHDCHCKCCSRRGWSRRSHMPPVRAPATYGPGMHTRQSSASKTKCAQQTTGESPWTPLLGIQSGGFGLTQTRPVLLPLHTDPHESKEKALVDRRLGITEDSGLPSPRGWRTPTHPRTTPQNRHHGTGVAQPDTHGRNKNLLTPPTNHEHHSPHNQRSFHNEALLAQEWSLAKVAHKSGHHDTGS